MVVQISYMSFVLSHILFVGVSFLNSKNDCWHLCNFTCECKNLVKFTSNFDALSFGNNAKVHTSHIIKDSYEFMYFWKDLKLAQN
jgi:hypothetical protein